VTTTTTPTLSGTAEANATIAVSVDSAQVGTATANNAGDWVYVLTTPLSEGVHTVSATAADAAGNTSPQSNVNSFTVDSIAPLAPVILAPAQMGFSSNPTPTYSGTAEALVSIDISVDGSSIGTTTAGADGTWELLQASALSEGAHTVEATAEDAVGRTSPSSALVAFTVDTVAPNVVIDSAPPSETTDRSANVSFSADEEGVSFECSVDAEPFAPCTSPRSLSALSDGAHSFAVRATDLAQNVDPSPASVTWTVITREMTDPVGPSGMEEQPSEEESTPGARGCGGCSSTANDSGSMFVTALLVLSLRRRLRRTSARSAS
jgi:sirohydrochlorin ferrochelatase